jgi:hypothetical protein
VCVFKVYICILNNKMILKYVYIIYSTDISI